MVLLPLTLWSCLLHGKLTPFTPTVPPLHSRLWLPVKFRVGFKIYLLTYMTLREKQLVFLHSMLAISLPSCFLRLNKGITLSVSRVKTNTCVKAFHSRVPPFGTRSSFMFAQPPELLSLGNVSKRISSTWPFAYGHQHARWPFDVTELFNRFCCWTPIQLLCQRAWLRWGYCLYRNLIDW